MHLRIQLRKHAITGTDDEVRAVQEADATAAAPAEPLAQAGEENPSEKALQAGTGFEAKEDGRNSVPAAGELG